MRFIRGVCVVLLALPSFAFAQYQRGGCIKEAPPPFYGPGYRATEPPTVTLCAPPSGTILELPDGKLACAYGECITDGNGQTLCARERGGEAFIDENQRIQCVGGCSRPSRLICRVPSQ